MRFAAEPAERALTRQITRGNGADVRGALPVEKGELSDGHDWARTSDLSRVKRLG